MRQTDPEPGAGKANRGQEYEEDKLKTRYRAWPDEKYLFGKLASTGLGCEFQQFGIRIQKSFTLGHVLT